ncbi:MAG: hypothetical protein H6Q76_1162 [Firmicutes bacterium]|nr:hypothetical protein [Bacillota bacterium]
MKPAKTQLMLSLLLAGLLLLGLQSAAFAATPPAAAPAVTAAVPAPQFVIPVEVREFTADALGTTLVQRTRDAFAADNRFRMSASEANRIIVRLYTRGISGKDPQTAYSFTVTFKLADSPDELFAGSTIGTCNFKEIPADAKGIVDMAWNQANNYPKLFDTVKKK